MFLGRFLHGHFPGNQTHLRDGEGTGTVRQMQAKSGQVGEGRGTQAEVAMAHARAATLFAKGLDNAEVAAVMGITERQARRYKEEVGPRLREVAADTMDAIAEGAAAARQVFAENAREMAMVVVLASRGELPQTGTDGSAGPEQEPAMVGTRWQAARAGLAFVLPTKVEATLQGPDGSKVDRVLALARLLAGDDDEEE